MHEHSHTTNSPEEALALLKYMADHNKHHEEELHELAHGVEGEAHELIQQAVEKLEESDALLKKAIELIESKG